jgi:hypothetical protein
MPGPAATTEELDDQTANPNGDELEEGASAEGEEGSGAADEGAESEGGETDNGEGTGETDEVVVTIGDETPTEEEDESAARPWVKDLRKRHREMERKLREVEAENAKLKGAKDPAAVVVGEKPTLAGCEYDTEKYEQEVEAWHERKRTADGQAAERQRAEEAQRAAWQARLDNFKKAATALKVSDFQEAEEVAVTTLSQTQQAIIVKGAKRPELLIYALGKNPKKAKELAAITDPVDFAFAAANLERDLKVTPRKTARAPERRVGSTVAGAAALKDTELARLQAEADKTGDRSKVAAYLRNKNKRAA